jgi:histidyl-tRNA synthetase
LTLALHASSLSRLQGETHLSLSHSPMQVGLTSADVGIKVNNRKVLQAVLEKYDTPEELFAPVCVVVDKLEKLPREKIEEELLKLGVSQEAMDGLLSSLSLTSLDALQEVLGEENAALAELQTLFQLAEAYGYADWLVFDASVVRGLAYYTGTVFEAFDKEGVLRAICGGGRYDKLMSAFGAPCIPLSVAE